MSQPKVKAWIIKPNIEEMESKISGRAQVRTYNDLESTLEETKSIHVITEKTIFHKMIRGFRYLIYCLPKGESRAFTYTVKWCQLYLKIRTLIDPKNEKLETQFEKTIPVVISYIIGCLQYNSSELNDYHYILLQTIDQLMENAKLKTLQKLADVEIETMACLWRPIDSVGDFNTQFMVIKLMSMFLKFADKEKQEQVMERVLSGNAFVFKNKLNNAVDKASYYGTFQNTARDLLNNYNSILINNVQVHSLRCISLTIGTNHEFYKPLNADDFWLDFNYGPRTLSFEGRSRPNAQAKLETIQVILNINYLELCSQTLTVHFCKATVVSKTSSKFTYLNKENTAVLQLSLQESQRFQKNYSLLKHFNHSSLAISISDGSDSSNDSNQPSTSQQKLNESKRINNTRLKSSASTSNKVSVDGIKSSKHIERQPVQQEDNFLQPEQASKRKRTFFESLKENYELSGLFDNNDHKPKRKRIQKRKTKETINKNKPNAKKQSATVQPTINTTKRDRGEQKAVTASKLPSIEQPTHSRSSSCSLLPQTNINNNEILDKQKSPPIENLLNTQVCAVILDNVCAFSKAPLQNSCQSESQAQARKERAESVISRKNLTSHINTNNLNDNIKNKSKSKNSLPEEHIATKYNKVTESVTKSDGNEMNSTNEINEIMEMELPHYELIRDSDIVTETETICPLISIEPEFPNNEVDPLSQDVTEIDESEELETCTVSNMDTTSYQYLDNDNLEEINQDNGTISPNIEITQNISLMLNESLDQFEHVTAVEENHNDININENVRNAQSELEDEDPLDEILCESEPAFQNAFYIRKIHEISQRVMAQFEYQENEMFQLKQNIARHMRQLEWLYDTLNEKTQKYECFKQNLQHFLQMLEINLKLETEKIIPK